MRFLVQFIVFVCPAILYSSAGSALEPREIFKAVDPSVVVVLASDAKGDKSNLGSGVIIAAQEVVTSCKIVESAADIVVSQGSTLRKATLHYKDIERDLCQLHLQEALPSGKTATISSAVGIETGQEIYTIGAPRGMEHTIIRAMVSGLHETTSSKARLMQVDVALGGGSIGSGVFDQNGQLIGIAAGKFKHGDSASYAVPADWLGELPKRSPDLLLSSTVPTAAPPTGSQSSQPTPAPADGKPGTTPRTGDRWKYQLVDGRKPAGIVSIDIVDSQGKIVRERVSRGDDKGFVMERTVDAGFQPTRFQDVIPLPGGYQLAEIAPYTAPGKQPAVGQRWGELPVTLLLGGYGYGKQKFIAEARVVGREKVRVPAGQFEAVHIQATSRKNLGSDVVRIECNYWYSADAMRTVKMSLDIKYSNPSFNQNPESYELISFEPAK